jgi:hypothetical protein
MIEKCPPKGIPTLMWWSNNPAQSYAGGGVAAVRASHAKQVKGDDPDKKG